VPAVVVVQGDAGEVAAGRTLCWAPTGSGSPSRWVAAGSGVVLRRYKN
jgi:hypothetical protein